MSLNNLSLSEIKECGSQHITFKGYSVMVEGSAFSANYTVTMSVELYESEDDCDPRLVSVYYGTYMSSLVEIKEEIRDAIDDMKTEFGITSSKQIKDAMILLNHQRSPCVKRDYEFLEKVVA